MRLNNEKMKQLNNLLEFLPDALIVDTIRRYFGGGGDKESLYFSANLSKKQQSDADMFINNFTREYLK